MPPSNPLTGLIKQFEYYKLLGERSIAQVTDEGLNWQFNDDSNSISIIVKHIHGNMLSRFTNFLTEDGEKEWRQRDSEFETEMLNRQQLDDLWQAGWKVTLEAIRGLSNDQLDDIVYIRNMGHSVLEALHRQLSHYVYHIGQIVYIAKQLKGEEWQSLSIPKGKSESYNEEKFLKPKSRKHYTDDL